MISQIDLRILSLMIEKADRLMEVMEKHTREEIESDYTLSDTVQFEFEKLYEDSERLSLELKLTFKDQLHIDQLRAIRNRVAHNYESVSLQILLDTIQNDIPILRTDLETIIKG